MREMKYQLPLLLFIDDAIKTLKINRATRLNQYTNISEHIYIIVVKLIYECELFELHCIVARNNIIILFVSVYG